MADEKDPGEATPKDEPAQPAVEVKRPPAPPEGEDMRPPFSQKEADHLVDVSDFMDEAVHNRGKGLDSPEFKRHEKSMEDAQKRGEEAAKAAAREKNQAKRDWWGSLAQVCQDIVGREWRKLDQIREDYIRESKRIQDLEDAAYKRVQDRYDRRYKAFDKFWDQSGGMSKQELLRFKDNVLRYVGDPEVRKAALSALHQRYNGEKDPVRPRMPPKPPHKPPENDRDEKPIRQAAAADPWKEVRPDLETLEAFYVDTRRFARRLSDENLKIVLDRSMDALTDMEDDNLPFLSSFVRMRAYVFESWARLVKPEFDALEAAYEERRKIEVRLKELG
jgi:hypothetical protein